MNKIYQLRNPFWLADHYVFSKMEFDLSLYDKGKVITYPYIKVNPRNKIEETGSDIRNVFPGYQIDEIIEKSSIANKTRSLVYKVIDMQYWGAIVSHDVLNPTPNGSEIIAGRRTPTGRASSESKDILKYEKKVCDWLKSKQQIGNRVILDTSTNGDNGSFTRKFFNKCKNK